MKARKIRPEEHIDALKILSIAFRWSKDFSGSDKEPERFYNGYETWRAFFNDDGKMCSAMEISPFKVIFEDKVACMAGVGGVISLPEERNKGYIRKLFQYCFSEMRENKQWFSFLYPFSSEYYRKFGYETSVGKVKYIVPLASFRHFTNSGQLKLYIPGTDDSHIKSIYDNFVSKRNFAVLRNDILWKRHIGEDPYKNNIFTYIWYNTEEKPMGYVTFKCQKRYDFGADMILKELIWIDNEALTGIFNFLGGFAPNYKDFIWETTEFYNLGLLFPDSSSVKIELSNFGMSRIVDLEEVLKLKLCPKGEGTLAFEVKDNFLEWNNGSFVVSWNKEGVKVEKKDCSPDLSCSIQVLTQLITGYVSLEDLIWSQDLKVIGNFNLLSSYFKRKPIYLNESF
ncbi:GNAT family N-acetyltransferase [Candidatus Clostridium radicumherbarum]|uniref:Enhanced intracellular survival protein Eis n=1 Tax=Candidatus Clostridium radicumherbarum TaxID=3381662 RepID=A0ABW8TT92_9CLOT